jgi:putative oxidoreductase
MAMTPSEEQFSGASGAGAFLAPALLIARIFMSAEFIFFGSMKLANLRDMQDYMEAAGVPGELIWLVIPVQVVGGLCILLGLHTRLAALVMIGFCLTATLLFHTNFADMREVSDFTKDLATAGGFLFLFAYGPGPLSIDAWLKRPRA